MSNPALRRRIGATLRAFSLWAYNYYVDILEQSFNKYRREDFVPDDIRDQTFKNIALPIGYGQTISQPSTVFKMLEWLEPEADNKILDVGSGSGWTTALLSYLVGQKGFIYAVERIPELLEFGRQNCQNAEVKNIKFYLADKEFGLPKLAPFDRILVSAATDKLPKSLLKQLKIDGKMVIPVNNDILEIAKLSDKNLQIILHPGYVFVPLI